MSRDTMLESLCHSLADAAKHSTGEVPPLAILWTDAIGECLPLVETLLSRLPQLLVHGEYDCDKRNGPAIWLKRAIDRQRPEIEISEGLTTIVYLPLLSRQTLRAGTGCPLQLQPLVEPLYRGTVWKSAMRI